ncbi:hypothetical protein HY090_01680 [Candidatus Kaiserbacteria bacterium]|nr:hypothetical protein [Candidatus Kaiserbacteria bacterium]
MITQKILIGSAFVISIFTLPSWVSVLVAILYLAIGGNPLVIICGGFIIDTMFGAPIAALHGFAYLYTFLGVILALVASYLKSAIFE